MYCWHCAAAEQRKAERAVVLLWTASALCGCVAVVPRGATAAPPRSTWAAHTAACGLASTSPAALFPSHDLRTRHSTACVSATSSHPVVCASWNDVAWTVRMSTHGRHPKVLECGTASVACVLTHGAERCRLGERQPHGQDHLRLLDGPLPGQQLLVQARQVPPGPLPAVPNRHGPHRRAHLERPRNPLELHRWHAQRVRRRPLSLAHGMLTPCTMDPHWCPDIV